MNLLLQEKLKAAKDKIQALETVISAAQAPSPSTLKVVTPTKPKTAVKSTLPNTPEHFHHDVCGDPKLSVSPILSEAKELISSRSSIMLKPEMTYKPEKHFLTSNIYFILFLKIFFLEIWWF